MWALYQVLIGLGLVCAAPIVLLRRGAHYREVIPGRLGLYGDSDGAPLVGGLWLHAVSVGEVGVAATLARALPNTPLTVTTTVTPTGQARARAALGERGSIAYLPFELGFAVRRFFRRFEPRLLILSEGDLWPLVLHHARRRGLPVVVVNGRVSSRTFGRLRRFPRIGRWIYSHVDRFAVQTETDRQRLLDLGVSDERIAVSGNLKFESPEPARLTELEQTIAGLGGRRPVLVAGSTMEGEEEQVLDAFAAIGGGERALLVLAPRHPERWDSVAALCRERGLETARRSAGASGRPDVLLLDTLGELAAVYRVARAAFIGGSLVPTGGHNPLEAARFGVPVVVGESMDNFQEIAVEFGRTAAWRQVKDTRGLATVWDGWLTDEESARSCGARGRAVVEANRGALESTLEMLRPYVTGLATGGVGAV